MDIFKKTFCEMFAKKQAAIMGIPVPNLEFRAKNRNNGRCYYTRNKIILSSTFIDAHHYRDIEQLLLHEMLHIVTPGDHHGQKFVEACDQYGCKQKSRYWEE